MVKCVYIHIRENIICDLLIVLQSNVHRRHGVADGLVEPHSAHEPPATNHQVQSAHHNNNNNNDPPPLSSSSSSSFALITLTGHSSLSLMLSLKKAQRSLCVYIGAFDPRALATSDACTSYDYTGCGRSASSSRRRTSRRAVWRIDKHERASVSCVYRYIFIHYTYICVCGYTRREGGSEREWKPVAI